jgi:hypothetical protein
MAQRLARLSLGSALLAAAVLGFGSSARAVPAAAQVIDRTFGCLPVVLTGKIRTVDIRAYPIGTVEAHHANDNRSPGFISVGSGGWEAGADLVSVRARRWARFAPNVSREGVYASIHRCSPSRSKIALTASGLPAVPTPWAKSVTCLGRGRVFVRVRATLQTGALWTPLITQSSDGAQGKVVEAKLAVRSERTGEPLAYLELSRDGTTKLWTSSRCVA